MSEDFYFLTGCKVNLYLKILGQRKDGLHNIDSVFLPLPRPSDSMSVERSNTPGLRLRCCPAHLENPSNILFKAYQLFARKTGYEPGLKIYLQKNVPAGAGLGGGSANAAALLTVLNRMAGSKALDRDALHLLAARTGGDVPFFMDGHPARVKGMGQELEYISLDLSGLMMLLICPGIHVDTGWAYRQWDLEGKNPADPENRALTSSLPEDNGSPLEENLLMANSFEQVVFKYYPGIRRIKTDMLKSGAAGCVMSGSGSSLVAVFRSRARVSAACNLLARESIPFYYYKF
ncbi:MAG: 4-(cytidine 5'-diphospho)-2-C-methyl-D-erythritol kinase [Desulfonatronovibrionaceae bacterium]